ncbi:DUF5926 family protein [Amycolatopsis suaedae]|uniref:DUF5926 domain-containing protein n=1 Tax=Amycolatopsis suaedae TaxID=2510978 RepID=A0A4Q7J5R3_9PSEU|nr:DUF5926 family protein [Amycolatopsis suaedae]RZQ62116.1 hypothetical protein EWH70_21280 [Amycolatopsis suaedae]
MGKAARKKGRKKDAGAPKKVRDVFVGQPFEGLAGEPELIALREFVPSATAPLTLATESDRKVTLGTVLPMAAAAFVRADGQAFLGMQVQTRSSDISRDLGRALKWALNAEPGDVLSVADTITPPAEGERLQDLLDPKAELETTLHKDFSWWLPEDTEPEGEVALSLERANAAIMPTERLGTGAYWVDAGERAHLRWVRPEPETWVLQALARLSAAGELGLGEGSRYAGSFRAHGLLVPVWDLDREAHAREWAEPAEQLGARLNKALDSLDDEPLNTAERRARDGLIGRQLTLR